MENMYLKRNIDVELFNWKNDTPRKPLLLRGARQVGKSTSVRGFVCLKSSYPVWDYMSVFIPYILIDSPPEMGTTKTGGGFLFN